MQGVKMHPVAARLFQRGDDPFCDVVALEEVLTKLSRVAKDCRATRGVWQPVVGRHLDQLGRKRVAMRVTTALFAVSAQLANGEWLSQVLSDEEAPLAGCRLRIGVLNLARTDPHEMEAWQQPPGDQKKTAP